MGKAGFDPNLKGIAGFDLSPMGMAGFDPSPMGIAGFDPRSAALSQTPSHWAAREVFHLKTLSKSKGTRQNSQLFSLCLVQMVDQFLLKMASQSSVRPVSRVSEQAGFSLQ